MTETRAPIKVEISHKTVIFTVALLIGLWFLVQIREIIIIIFLSIILVSALLKPVEWLSSFKIPRLISVVLVYIFTIALIAFVIGIIIPPFIDQSKQLASRLPQIIATINNFFIFNEIPIEDLSATIAKQIQNLTGDIIRISTAIFSSIFLLLTIFVLSFYFLLDWNKFIKLVASPFSGKQEKKVVSLITSIENGLGRWVRGQIALSFIIGVLVFIGLTVSGIPYALPLALVAALLEIIPIFGPIVASIPAILVGLTISPILGLAVAALYIIIQQLENNLIVPVVMSKAIGLQPPIVMIALLIGAKIAGIGGAFLAIPFIVLAKIVFSDLLIEDQKLEDSLSEQ